VRALSRAIAPPRTGHEGTARRFPLALFFVRRLFAAFTKRRTVCFTGGPTFLQAGF